MDLRAWRVKARRSAGVRGKVMDMALGREWGGERAGLGDDLMKRKGIR
jgi:transposase-like protein